MFPPYLAHTCISAFVHSFVYIFLKDNLHFTFFQRQFFFSLKDLAPDTGFGGGPGAAPEGLNQGGGVLSSVPQELPGPLP